MPMSCKLFNLCMSQVSLEFLLLLVRAFVYQLKLSAYGPILNNSSTLAV